MATNRDTALEYWLKRNQYCPNCGEKMMQGKDGMLKCCNCENIVFPRIDPCVLVLVKKNDKILLVRHVQRNQDRWTILAGYAEAGESIEETVVREVKEEVGINVKNIVYHGSQSWPHPAQLMFGFTAEYDSGEITLQKEEIAKAKWFDANDNPANPPVDSLAYKMIRNSKKLMRN